MLDGRSDRIEDSSIFTTCCGCWTDYFVIDAGLYADDNGWWDDVGASHPSTTRSPSGFDELIKTIREAGLMPGLWLDPEVVGVRSAVAATLPAESFFQRDGERVIERR